MLHPELSYLTREVVAWLSQKSRLHLSEVANEQGSFTTPSFVSFTEEERLIGEAAKNQAAMNPKNTVFDIKSVLPLRKAVSFLHQTLADILEDD